MPVKHQPPETAPAASRAVYARAFHALLFRALRRTIPLAAGVSFCFGCFLGMLISDVPWLDRLIIDSPLFGRLLAIILCPMVALILSDIFVGMEAAMTLSAAADQNLDGVWLHWVFRHTVCLFARVA